MNQEYLFKGRIINQLKTMLTEQDYKDVIYLRKQDRSEGKMEGVVWTAVGGLFYLILIAAVMEWLNL